MLAGTTAFSGAWNDAKQFYFLRYTIGILAKGKTAHEEYFGKPIRGPIIKFGAAVEYSPSCLEEQGWLYELGKAVSGIFASSSWQSGCFWNGDCYIIEKGSIL